MIILLYLICVPFAMYLTVGFFVEDSKQFKGSYSQYRKEQYWQLYRKSLTWAHLLGGFLLSLIPIINVIMMVIGLVMSIMDMFKYLNTIHVYKEKVKE